MPELPEVETVRRQLLPLLRGQRIRKMALTAPGLLKNCEPAFFESALQGQTIVNLHRRGKYLIWECRDLFPVFHLGMSGIFLKDRARSLYPQHIHMSLELENGGEVFYQDFRRFGKIWLYREWPQIANLGIDPIEETPDLADFAGLLARKKQNVKLFLMDQSQIAGIGNIYASEILFEAAISPERNTASLDPAETARLYRYMLEVLNAAIERFGTTYSAYQTVSGESGENQNFLKVYQRNGQPCVRCGAIIEKSTLGNRSTFFCPDCQL
ncbi:MAG TPA: bifunctional DNA-formamidopyrimidine glycosylase/DNA-(apurinic or apyrimidinic site) lyase [Calditrichia bacterium]|nr:bifunctional DNA-formamidopyrimidine glycosylase/DNA-(apurinic or apyrimidinic site) lyase [Calditrichota bacterium]HQV34544.1 bifunctional DNA-formamidopyrimidine glycosylase/DNA-(apurinic or apyrimidinic site) lyase [Calditrichia bacterium]